MGTFIGILRRKEKEVLNIISDIFIKLYRIYTYLVKFSLNLIKFVNWGKEEGENKI